MNTNKLLDEDEVICPKCCHQFRAIPVNVQAILAALEAVQVEPVASLGQPDKLEQIIDEYIAEYEQLGEDDQGRDCYHLPDERERDLIKDAIIGLLAYPEWDDAWGEHLRTIATPQQAAPEIDAMVNRFLGWHLPKDFSPDCGIKFTPLGHPNDWPIGTNLLTATQAKEMITYMLAAAQKVNQS